MNVDPATIAEAAIKHFKAERGANSDQMAVALAIEHIRLEFEGTTIAFAASCCGAEPHIHERHSNDCENRPPGGDCVVCKAMR